MNNIMFSIYLDKSEDELKQIIKKLKQDVIYAKRSVNEFYNQHHCYDMEDVLYMESRKSILESAENALKKIRKQKEKNHSI